MNKKQCVEYPLSTKASRAEIVDVLRKLEADAEARAAKHAYTYVCHSDFELKEGDPDELAAFYYEGKRRLLRSLVWALSGEAEEEGSSNPSVGILL